MPTGPTDAAIDEIMALVESADEPAGSVHSLYVPAENTAPTEALSIIYGDVEYIDPDGHVLRVSNWKTALANYNEGCEVAGIPRPNGLLR